MILVIAEQRDGTLNRATWEAIAAAQQLAAGDAAQGRGARARQAGAVAQELAAAGVGEVLAVDRPGARTVHAGRLRRWRSRR